MEVITQAVLWEITMACNLACRYCYNMFQVERPTSHVASISRDEALVVADRIVEAGIKTVVISGGEPLVWPALVIEVGTLLRQKGLEVSVITNGTLLTEKLAQQLRHAGVQVFVSLTAPIESLHDDLVNKRGAYRKTVSGIGALVNEGVPTGINMVVTQRNKDLVQEMGFFAAEIGVKAFSASRLIPPWGSRGNIEIERLLLDRVDVKKMFYDLRIVRQRTNLPIFTQSCYPLCLMADFDASSSLKYCSIGGPALAIGANGEIRPCALMPQICGNVLTEGFGPSLARMARWRIDALAPSECKDCRIFEICKGGCRIAAHFDGNIAGLDMHANPHAIKAALDYAL